MKVDMKIKNEIKDIELMISNLENQLELFKSFEQTDNDYKSMIEDAKRWEFM